MGQMDVTRLSYKNIIGIAITSITEQVVALIPVLSVTSPAIMPPIIPPTRYINIVALIPVLSVTSTSIKPPIIPPSR